MLSESRRGGAIRGLILLLVIGVWLALAGLGGQSIGRLSEVQENDASAFLPRSAESTRAAEQVSGFRGETTLPAIVVIEDDGQLDDQAIGQIQAFADGVPALELPDGRTIEDVLLGPVVPVPSEDGEAVLLAIPLDGDAVQEQVGEGRVVIEVVEVLREALADDLADYQTWVTGPAGAISDLVDAFAGIDGLLIVVALVVVLVILILVYRSPSLPFTVLLTSVFALAAAGLAVYHLAANGILDLDGQSQGILFILVIGAATDYSLLLVARYREELRRADAPVTAMARAWRASFPPITASAGTVAAGLLCLLLSDLSSNASLGPVATIGIAAAYLASLTLLPALLLAGGKHSRLIFWPRIPRREVEQEGHVESLPALEARSGAWGRLSRTIARRPRPVWVITALALVAAAAWLPTFRAEGTSESEVFLAEVESAVGAEALARHFDAGQVEPVTVIVPEADAEEALDAVTGVNGITSASFVTEAPTNGPPDPEAAPLVVDGNVLIEAVTDVASESREALDIVALVRTEVHDAAAESIVGGAAAERLDTRETSQQDLRNIVPAVLLVILLVLIVLLRSILAPVLLMIANVLSFAAALGVSAIVFNHVLGFPGADPTVPLYAFVFLIALGIDYSIFLMTRVREEALLHGTREGVRRGLTVTGGVITSAGIVLAATFSALAVIPLLFLAQLAFIVAFGVLLDTLIVRSLLVPALVHDIGRRVWWPWKGRIPADEPDTAGQHALRD